VPRRASLNCVSQWTISQTEIPVARIDRGMTVAEWADLPEDEPGELVNGRLVEEEVPDSGHELIVGWLIQVLRMWVVPIGGVVLSSDVKFAVSVERGRKPDVTVFFPGSRKPPRRGVIQVPPDIAIEVISARPRDSRRDRIQKMDEYAVFGVRWYWLVAPEARTLEVLELGSGGRYVRALSVDEGLVTTVPGCEGLQLDLNALWSELDRLEPEDEAADPE
jgi:Uma2 family endonuclease